VTEPIKALKPSAGTGAEKQSFYRFGRRRGTGALQVKIKALGPSDHIQNMLYFGLCIVEMRAESYVLATLAVLARRTDYLF
jgi:hypothetical protein